MLKIVENPTPLMQFVSSVDHLVEEAQCALTPEDYSKFLDLVELLPKQLRLAMDAGTKWLIDHPEFRESSEAHAASTHPASHG